MLLYNAEDRVMQYCDGTNWIALGPVLDDVTGGLVGHWKLDDGAGGAVAADSSGNGNDGTLTSMDVNTDWVSGQDGWALEFDRSDDYVEAADHDSLDNTVTLTMSAWVKPTVMSRYGNDSLLCAAAHNGDYANFGIMGSWGGERACDGVFIVFCCA